MISEIYTLYDNSYFHYIYDYTKGFICINSSQNSGTHETDNIQYANFKLEQFNLRLILKIITMFV